MNSQTYKDLTADIENSSFYAITYFADGGHMRGYSKKIGYTEPKDKQVCLFNMFLRCYEIGYLRAGTHYNRKGRQIQEARKVVYYQNHTNLEVFTFYPHHSEPNFNYPWTPRFLDKVDDFYRDVRQQMNVTALKAKYYISQTAPDKPDLDLSSPRFYSAFALGAYGEELLSKGYAPGQIEDFQRKYSETYFVNGKMNLTILAQYQNEGKKEAHGREVATADARAKATMSLEKLQQKFNQSSR